MYVFLYVYTGKQPEIVGEAQHFPAPQGADLWVQHPARCPGLRVFQPGLGGDFTGKIMGK